MADSEEEALAPVIAAPRSRVPGWLKLVGVLLPAGFVVSTCLPGEHVGEVVLWPKPAELTIEAETGDQLSFKSNVEVIWNGPRTGLPDGCDLTVTLASGEQVLATTRCDLFHLSEGVSVGCSTRRYPDRATGMRGVESGGTSLGCALRVPKRGPVSLQFASNLDSCVARPVAASIDVYREAAD